MNNTDNKVNRFVGRIGFRKSPTIIIAAIVTEACKQQCPSGYPMTIKSQPEWTALRKAVNEGIDSRLEAVTERSTFNAVTGECLIHPEELHVLLRRLEEQETEEGMSLRKDILTTLGIELELETI